MDGGRAASAYKSRLNKLSILLMMLLTVALAAPPIALAAIAEPIPEPELAFGAVEAGFTAAGLAEKRGDRRDRRRSVGSSVVGK